MIRAETPAAMNIDGRPWRTIWLEPDGRSVGVIDQTRLPHAFETRRLDSLETAAAAIRTMVVRGAPLIGVTGAYGLMLALQADAEALGASLAFHTPLLSARCREQGFESHMGGAEPMTLSCRELINCAGLSAPEVASRIAGLPTQYVPQARLCKGSYFSFSGRAPFRHLVYPAPESAGLGVHMTLDLAGQARFGPDVEWVDKENYDVDRQRCESFYAEIRSYWPGLPEGSLQASYAGIRPKLQAPGEAAQDFRIEGPEQHGFPGLVQLLGIESPGLTACLAIAKEVASALRQGSS